VAAWRRNLFAVTAAGFIGFTGFTLVMPFLPLYFQQLGLTDVGDIAFWSGLSLGVTPALTACLSPFWGRLADRFGKKIMIERSLASFVIVMSAMAFVTTAWHVFALRAIQGLFAGYGALTLTMAAEIAPPGKTAYAIGTVQTAQRIGPAIGPIIGGVVAQIVGIRRAFFVTAAFYFVALCLVFFLYDEGPVRATARKSDGAFSFRSVLAFENFVLLMAVVFGLQFVDRSFGPVLPLFIAQLGTPLDRVPLMAGLLFSIAAGSAAVGNQLTQRLLKRWSPRAIISGSAIAGALGCVIYSTSMETPWLLLATPIIGIAMGSATTCVYTAATGVIPKSAHGASFGLLTSASLAGLAISPIVSGFLGATSIRAVFILDTVALIVLAATVTRLMVITPVERTTAPATEEL
jgi:DHA1 family multidrug resistance protein-like MFS transporter